MKIHALKKIRFMTPIKCDDLPILKNIVDILGTIDYEANKIEIGIM